MKYRTKLQNTAKWINYVLYFIKWPFFPLELPEYPVLLGEPILLLELTFLPPKLPKWPFLLPEWTFLLPKFPKWPFLMSQWPFFLYLYRPFLLSKLHKWPFLLLMQFFSLPELPEELLLLPKWFFLLPECPLVPSEWPFLGNTLMILSST